MTLVCSVVGSQKIEDFTIYYKGKGRSVKIENGVIVCEAKSCIAHQKKETIPPLI